MIRWLALVTTLTILSGCAAPSRMQVPISRATAMPIDGDAGMATPVTESAVALAQVGPISSGSEVSEEIKTVVERLDGPPRSATPAGQSGAGSKLSNNNSLTVSADQMPLRSLITYVFNDLIKANFVIADSSPTMDQPVTLGLDKPVSSRQLFKVVADLLIGRSLSVSEKDGVFFIGPASGKTGADVPIGYGSRPQDVPDAPGKVLQAVFLKYASVVAVEKIATDFLDVQIWRDQSQNAVFFAGTRDVILKVLDIVRLIDQPSVRSSRVGLINLSYISSRELTEQLTTLLENEGIPTGVGRAEGKSVALVPIDQVGAVVVFALGAQLLDRVEFWAKQVDRPGKGSTERYFIYQPKYARAIELGESLAALIGAQPPSAGGAGNQSRDTRSALSGNSSPITDINSRNALRRDAGGSTTSSASNSLSIKGDGVTLSVDGRSNALVFFTTGPRYESLLPLIRRLDVPPRQILLEATIAEVSLTGEFANGVEFAFTQFRDPNPLSDDGPSVRFSGGTDGRLGLTSSGLALNFISSVTDQVRLRLSASDGKINVLSRPSLVVRDGSTASISVGNDVPTVGATASDPIESQRQVTTVLYRKTGLELNVTPSVNAQGLVVMEIDQRISNSVPGASGVQGAPVFFERSVKSEIVSNSGQTVMLAGLISESSSDSTSSVPGISRLPLVGSVFSSVAKKREKTELVLLLSATVMSGPSDTERVIDSMKNFLSFIELDIVEGRQGQPARLE
jgi:general secretion pathway protein D